MYLFVVESDKKIFIFINLKIFLKDYKTIKLLYLLKQTNKIG